MVVQSKVFIASIQSQEDPFVYCDSLQEGISLGYDGCAFCLKPYNHG